MTAISYVRYDILKRNLNEKSIDKKIILKTTIVSIVYSLFWCVAPLFGWSHYALEDGLVSCTVEYNEKSWNVISYNLGMLLFVFVLPFGVTIISNIKSLLIVKYLYILYYLFLLK